MRGLHCLQCLGTDTVQVAQDIGNAAALADRGSLSLSGRCHAAAVWRNSGSVTRHGLRISSPMQRVSVDLRAAV